MKEQILAAMQLTEKVVREAIGEQLDMPAEEKAIIDKWIKAGVIEYAKKRIVWSKEVYFPLIEAPEFNNISTVAYQRILIHYLNKYNTGCKLSIFSVNDYMSKYYKYNIKPVLLKKSEAGAKQIKEELVILEEEGL